MLEQMQTAAMRRDWAYVIEHGPAALASLTGDGKARAHLLLAAAYSSTATCADDWRMALRHAHAGREVATPNGTMYVWALQKLSSILVDMGRPTEAHKFAKAYLKVAHVHPVLAGITPYVLRDLGSISYQQRRFRAAVYHYTGARDAFAAVGNVEEVSRTESTNLVWANYRLGRTEEAKRFAMRGIVAELEYLRFGALAALSLAEGDAAQALIYGEMAIRGRRQGHDFVDAAEVYLVMASASRMIGSDERTFITKAHAFAARQAQDVWSILRLTLAMMGGDFEYEESARGSSNPLHRGCLTTGVA